MPTGKRTPTGLGDGGRELWRSIVSKFELRPDELRVLHDACLEAELVDRL